MKMERACCWTLALLMFSVVGVVADESRAELPLALKGLDPVKLVSGHEVAGSETITATDERWTYRFASQETRSIFLGQREQYRIQGDGTCMLAPGTPSKPDIFTVYDEKIYAFASTGCVARFKDDPESYLNPPEYEVRNVAIVLFEGVELLDFAGPAEVFAAAGRGQAFNVYTVSDTKETVFSQGFLEVKPEFSVADSPAPDLLVVPGGGVGSVLSNPELMEWIKKSSEKALTMSVCNGALVLARTGLLDGLEATTHHGSIDSLRRSAQNTKVHDDRRFVDNGKVITAAGVSAGIDMALHVVERLLGEARAVGVARYMEYDWQPEARPGLVLRASVED